ncbi:PIN domain-containing protein [Mucilaginibacter jinjuensis]|uniref:PIN domain-containing protein n=1 Tax=Mucilaginibacter jinjuensis TaxID=1176721 RepID=A0ABY7T6M2_9SPHI|nr:PIN domain-containing protein [Mucilaginibacter jinjuensis]WCT11996.1 PIN domain-containing protein [Mucilaginibacter jinjuensis]
MPEEKNYFLYKKQYPDHLSILSGHKLDLNKFIKSAIFVIDANSLLVPYNLGQESLKEIRRIYLDVLKPERLIVPAHALREFAKHRSIKISELFTEVDKALSTIPVIKDLNYPILEDLKPYKDLLAFKKEFAEHIKPYKTILKDLQASVNEWNWFDPVTQLYHDVFTASNIIETTLDEVNLIKEFEDRMNNNIPPGNQDKAKDVNSIGDFLIWKSILEYAKAKKVDIVLVTNDEKNDWMLKGNKKSISTRFELVDEFCRYTDGQQFICLNFEDFLKIQGAQESVVIEVATAVVQSNQVNDYYNRLGNGLNAVNTIITSFLNNPTGPDDNYMNSDTFSSLSKNLIELLRNEEINVFLGKRAELADKVIYNLTIMNSLNYEIHYQAIRMKRNTFNQQSDLRKLCQLTLPLIEEIEFYLI